MDWWKSLRTTLLEQTALSVRHITLQPHSLHGNLSQHAQHAEDDNTHAKATPVGHACATPHAFHALVRFILASFQSPAFTRYCATDLLRRTHVDCSRRQRTHRHSREGKGDECSDDDEAHLRGLSGRSPKRLAFSVLYALSHSAVCLEATGLNCQDEGSPS